MLVYVLHKISYCTIDCFTAYTLHHCTNIYYTTVQDILHYCTTYTALLYNMHHTTVQHVLHYCTTCTTLQYNMYYTTVQHVLHYCTTCNTLQYSIYYTTVLYSKHQFEKKVALNILTYNFLAFWKRYFNRLFRFLFRINLHFSSLIYEA